MVANGLTKQSFVSNMPEYSEGIRMFSIRTWNDDGMLKKIVAVSDENPYRRGTFEWEMVNYVLRKGNGSFLSGTAVREHGRKLAQRLSDRNLENSLDPWAYDDLFHYAVSLARLAGLIRISHNFNSDKRRFGVYMEDGMLSVLDDNKMMALLGDMKNEERRKALTHAIYVNDAVRRMMMVPTYSISKDSSKKEIRISGIKAGDSDFESISDMRIPIAAYASPNEHWVRISTRGLFHHMGDQAFFIMAAQQYGEAYALGRGAFGDLAVLSKDRQTVFGTASGMDFDYIYGVPQGTPGYPSKDSFFEYSGRKESESRQSSSESSRLDSFYWRNEAFVEFAKRRIWEASFDDMASWIMDRTFDELNGKMGKAISDAISGDDGSFKKIAKSFKKASRCVYRFRGETHEKLMKIIGWKESEPFNAIFLISARYEMGKGFMEAMDRAIKEGRDGLVDFSSIFCEVPKKRSMKDNAESFEALATLWESLKEGFGELAPWSDSHNEIAESAMRRSAFFYKTAISKAHCDIVNPNGTNMGFFMKNGEGSLRATMVNPVASLIKYAKGRIDSTWAASENTFKDFFKEEILTTLTKGMSRSVKELFGVWSKSNEKHFVMSELVDMRNEYRIFVIGGRPVAGTPCFRNSTPLDKWRNGRFDPRLCDGHNADKTELSSETRDRVAKYAKFARRFCQEMSKIEPESKNYVLDVAWSNDLGEPLAIEINSITWSGAYQIDMNRICSAIVGRRYRYEDDDSNMRYSFSALKDEAWNRMRQDGLIAEGEEYALNGWERTKVAFDARWVNEVERQNQVFIAFSESLAEAVQGK